jgi:hypothetical protein
MRADLVVPVDVRFELRFESARPEGHEREPPKAFLLHAAPKALDDSDASMLPDRSEAGPDVATRAPRAILRAELRSLVGDDVPRGTARVPDGMFEQLAKFGCTRLFQVAPLRNDGARKVIDDGRDPKAERPEHRPGKRQPRIQKPKPVGTTVRSMCQT